MHMSAPFSSVKVTAYAIDIGNAANIAAANNIATSKNLEAQ